MTDGYAQPERCDGCHYKTLSLTFNPNTGGQHEEVWLCSICNDSVIGRAARQPHVSTYRDVKPVLEAIGYCANVIIEQVWNRTQR